MRISIHIDSASEAEMRALALAVVRATGEAGVTVGVDGPEKYVAHTNMLRAFEGEALLRLFAARLTEIERSERT